MTNIPVGIYCIWPADKLPPRGLLASPHVATLAARFTWAALEPRPGAYDFATLARTLALAKQHGKGVGLTVFPGDTCPAWLKCKRFTSTHQGKRVSVPVPWDAPYVAAFKRLIKALGERLGSELEHVKITGVNTQGGEMSLPHSPADAVKWRRLGYSHDRIVDTAEEFAEAWANTFRGLLVLPIQNNGLPMTDERNPVFTIADELRLSCREWLVIASHGLSAKWANAAVKRYADRGQTVGFQMLAPVTGDATFRMNGKVPGEPREILTAALVNGISSGARYVEVYKPDIESPAMAGAFEQARRLWGI